MGVSDEAWISRVSKAGYFVTTEDYEILQNANQSKLIMHNRLGLLTGTTGPLGLRGRGLDQAESAATISNCFSPKPFWGGRADCRPKS